MFPTYIFAVGGGGKRATLGMFGYDYDREILEEEHFKWLIAKLIQTNRHYRIYIIDTETANKEKDRSITDYLNSQVNRIRLELSRKGYRGDLTFISINLEPPHGYSYDCIGGVRSINVFKEYIRNNGGKYYWLNASEGNDESYEYGDVEPNIYKKVMTVLGNNIISIQNGVNRNRAITKSLWVYYLMSGGTLPNLVNEDIAIIGGLGGGTGSALILELAKRYYGNNRIYIFGFLPACNGESSLSYSCGYITLTELEKLFVDNPDFRSSVYVFLIPLNFVNPQTGIAYTGETQDVELKKFPEALLYTILTYFRQAHGAGQVPVDVPDNVKMVRPFILASTYIIKVFGSKQIESAFGDALKHLKNALSKINKRLMNFNEDSGDPDIRYYPEIIDRFEKEFNLMEWVIELYEKIGGFNPQINDIVSDLRENYLQTLKEGFRGVRDAINKYGLDDKDKLENYLVGQNLNYYALVRATTEDMYRKFEGLSVGGSDVDTLFLEVLKIWLHNLCEFTRRVSNISKWFEETIGVKSYALFFLNTDENELDEITRNIHLQRGNINRELRNIDKEIKTLQNIKRDILKNIENDTELLKHINQLAQIVEDKSLLTDRTIVNNFRGYLEKFIEYLLNLRKRDLENYEDNFRRLVTDIESKLRSDYPDYSDVIEKFKQMLKVAEKYDQIVSKNKLYVQLTKVIGHRYHHLRCGKVRGRDHCTKRDKLKNELDIELNDSFSVIRVGDDNNYQPTISVKGKPLNDYMEKIIESKENKLKEEVRQALINATKQKADILQNVGIDFSGININDVKSSDDLLNRVEELFNHKIRELSEQKDLINKTIREIEDIRECIADMKGFKVSILSSLNKIENMLGSLIEETCDQSELAKIQYTLGISRHGDFGYLLMNDSIVKNDVNNYIERQIDCFIQRNKLFLGYKKIPIYGKGLSISFDKVFILIGVPEGVKPEVIEGGRIFNLVSRRFYPGGMNILNYHEGNINVSVYDITTQDTLTITFILVGLCLDNIAWIDKYYECFENGGQDVGINQVGDAIYIRYVYDLENGIFYVRRLIEDSELSDVYVNENFENILSRVKDKYEIRTFVRRGKVEN